MAEHCMQVFGYKIKYWLYGLLSAIVLANFIAGFTVFDSYMDNKEFQFGWPPIVVIKKRTTTS